MFKQSKTSRSFGQSVIIVLLIALLIVLTWLSINLERLADATYRLVSINEKNMELGLSVRCSAEKCTGQFAVKTDSLREDNINFDDDGISRENNEAIEKVQFILESAILKGIWESSDTGLLLPYLGGMSDKERKILEERFSSFVVSGEIVIDGVTPFKLE